MLRMSTLWLMFQAYFQRVLSQKDPKYTPLLSVGAGVGCILMAVPAVLMGAVGASTGWKTCFNLYLIFWYPQWIFLSNYRKPASDDEHEIVR